MFFYLILLLSMGLAAATVPTASGVEVNIADFGAKGDDEMDDTNAFERAMEAAAAAGSTIRLPMGKYVLTRPLKLEFQHLVGLEAGGWNSDHIPMPTLIVGQTEGPTITLGTGASIHGVAILDDEHRRMDPHPPAIQVEGQVILSNVRIQYPYDGIIFSHATENGRSNIENVFIVSPGHDGIHVTITHDIATLRNIEVWCNLGFSEGAGFRFRHNDELHASRLFALACRTGFVFEEEPVKVKQKARAGTYGTFVDCSTDGCDKGWRVTGWAMLNVLGGDFWNHHAGITLESELAKVKICGADLSSNGQPVVLCDEIASLIVTGCTIGGAPNTKEPYVVLNGAKSAALSGNIFDERRPAISVEKDVRRCAITGNIFPSSKGNSVSVDRGEGARIAISGNVAMDE